MKPIILLVTVLFSSLVAEARHREDLWVPQTHTLEQGIWQVNLERKASLDKGPGQPQHMSALGFSVGIFEKDIVGVEGGLEWEEPAEENLTRGIYGHLRIRANDIQKDGWAFALGIEKLGFVPNKNDINMIYLNLQNKIGDDWIFGVGGYNGSSRFLKDENGKEDPRGAFLGVWRQIQGGEGRLGIEHMTGRNFFGYTFLGATLALADYINGSLGYGIGNNQSLVKDWILARVSVEFE